METNFSPQQLADPQIARANEILRRCVHCGFCTATCPTFLLRGDELDSPRGRIYLIKDMLENERDADARTVRHLDRCLSCLSCMTTCPSGVHYMHLIDHARAHVHETYKRPLGDRALRWLLSLVLPRPALFRLALLGAGLARPLARYMPGRLKGLVAMAPGAIPSPSPVDRPQVLPAQGPRRMRVALLNGCAQKALAPTINEATVNLLTRHGVEVVVARGAGCCGALVHHMGDTAASHRAAKRNIEAWWRIKEEGGLDHIIINTSGCGTTVKDYGAMFANDPAMAERASTIAAMTRDVTEVMATLGLNVTRTLPPLKVAYHSACSMQHGQKITSVPQRLLGEAGLDVVPVPESHICCGSAGTYNLLQPELARQLQARKAGNIASTGADVVAAGNLGCMVQIGQAVTQPVVHTVEVLDWATGGEVPEALEPLVARMTSRGATAEDFIDRSAA
ncbi:MAG: glycolate oxidase subunit GlcF [Pseudomonadota bacterium]